MLIKIMFNPIFTYYMPAYIQWNQFSTSFDREENINLFSGDSRKNIEETILLIENNIDTYFPKKVLDEAKEIEFINKKYNKNITNSRKDFTDEFIITID